MKTKELKSRPLKELLELQRRVSAAIKTKQAQMKNARERILALAKRCGVSLREIGIRTGRGPDKAPRKSRAKFVNPKDSSMTWSGKGRPPLWYKAMNGAGSSATH